MDGTTTTNEQESFASGGGDSQVENQNHTEAMRQEAQSDEDDVGDRKNEMSLTELLYSAASYHAIVKPVSITMILSALAVLYIDTEEGREDREEQFTSYNTVWSTSSEDGESESSTGKALGISLANGLIIVGVICVMTFVIVLLYKYRCMKCLLAYMIISSAVLLGFLGGTMFKVAIDTYRLSIDVFSFYFTMFNFAIVGTASIFYQRGIPTYVTQGYLVSTSVILAWQLSHFDEWTTWTLLVLLALYDLCAVLTPCGPLKALVNLMSEDDSPDMPGLLYEAELPAEARRPGRSMNAGGGGGRQQRNNGNTTATGGDDNDAADQRGSEQVAEVVSNKETTRNSNRPQQNGDRSRRRYSGASNASNASQNESEDAARQNDTERGATATRSTRSAASSSASKVATVTNNKQRTKIDDDESSGGAAASSAQQSTTAAPPTYSPTAAAASPPVYGKPVLCTPSETGVELSATVDTEECSPPTSPASPTRCSDVSTVDASTSEDPRVEQQPRREPPPPRTGMIPLALAKIYRLPYVSPTEDAVVPRRASATPLLGDDNDAEDRQRSVSPNTLLAEQYTPQQLRCDVEVTYPRNGGRIERRAGHDGEPRYLVLDSRGTVKRVLLLDQEGKVFEETQVVQNARNDGEVEDEMMSNNSIKLGLGDFIFYSLLVSRAALYSFTTFASCMLVILAGLGATLVLLAVYHHALPALPISIFLGVIFYLLTRLLIEPWIQDMLRTPFYL